MSASLLGQIFILFGLIFMGYLAAKTHILDDHANACLSGFLLKMALPATILNSAFQNLDADRRQILSVAVVAVSIFIAIPILSYFITKGAGMGRTHQLMLNYSNLGFMGIPIISSVFGERYVIFTVIFMMVFNVHIFSVGVITLQGKPDSIKAMAKKLCSPGILSAVLAFVIVLVRISVPSTLGSLIESLGSVTTPMAMIVIGSQLGQVSLLQTVKNRQHYLIALLKLVVYPALVYGVLWLLIGRGVTTQIATILIGMPIAGNVTMLCSGYGGETTLAAEATCITTLLSILTIPIMLALVT